MPFKSEAQRRKFYAMAAKGEISKAKLNEWERETPDKKLPEKVASEKDLNARTIIREGGDYALGKLGLFVAIHNAYISERDRERYAKPLEKEGGAPFISAGTKRLGKALSWGGKKLFGVAKTTGKAALGAGKLALKYPTATTLGVGIPVAFGAGVAKAANQQVAMSITRVGAPAKTRRLKATENPIDSIKNLIQRQSSEGDAQTGLENSPMPGVQGAAPQIQRVGV